MEYIENFVNLVNNDSEYANFILGCIVCFGIFLSFIIVKISNKLMSDKLKIRLEKLLLIFSACSFVAFGCCNLFVKKYELFFLYILLVVGILTAEWCCLIKTKRLTPDKYIIKQKNEQEFNDYVKEQLIKNNYKMMSEVDNIKIFKSNQEKWCDTFFAIINFDMLVEQEFIKKYQLIYDYVLKNSKSLKRLNVVDMILVVTVNKINSDFNGYCSDVVSPNLRFSILSTGVSFGGKKLYIPNTIFSVPALNKMKKKLIKILALEKSK